MKAVKVIALWALLSVTGFLGYVFHWSNIEFAVAWLWAVVIFLIFEVSKLTDASLKTVVDDNAKIAKQIEQGEAVEPKHHPPIRNPSTYPDQERMFQDFAGFANRVNHDLQMTGWRLQEQPDGLGVRNYKILFNGLDVGKLNIKPFDFPYETADSRIAVDVNITHVEFFAYGTVYFFLQTLILLICADTDVNFRLGKADIDHHLAAYLLDSVRKPKSLYPFSMYIVGRPLNYFDRGEVREESHRFWENWRKKLNATS